MSQPVILGSQGAIALLVLVLAGCAPYGGSGETSSSAPAPTETASAGGDDVRFLITCFAADGSEVATFTKLEEAWASTNYMHIDHCEASAGPSGDVELTAEEQAIAETAQAGVPDEDLTDLYLTTLAACVRVAPDSSEGLATYPTSVLEAALELCPEAPHAGAIETELSTRG
jgi:hypothetical protein